MAKKTSGKKTTAKKKAAASKKTTAKKASPRRRRRKIEPVQPGPLDDAIAWGRAQRRSGKTVEQIMKAFRSLHPDMSAKRFRKGLLARRGP